MVLKRLHHTQRQKHMTIAQFLYNLSLKFGYDEDERCRTCWRAPGWIQYPRQSSIKTIDAMTLAETIQATDGIGPVLFHNSDAQYKLVDVEHFKNWLRFNPVSSRTYIADVHDCDNFSKELLGDVSKWDPGLAFGEIWMRPPGGGCHALNWLMDIDRTVWLVEPQNDKVFRPTTLWFTYWLRL